jgi:hypothetical protein
MTGRSPDTFKWFNENIAFENKDTVTHLDICNLDRNGVGTARELIKTLLSSAVIDQQIDCSPNTDDQLFRLLINDRNQVKFNKISTLGLGFPIIRLPGKKNQPSYLAPLFIWPLSIQKTEHNYQWKFTREKDAGLSINYALHQYLLQQHKIDLLKLSHPITNKENFSAIALSKICYELSAALGSKEDLFVDQIVALPTKTDKHILCSAVLGAFSWAKAQVSYKHIGKTPTIQHPFGLQTLDPAQEHIIDEFWNNELVQVLNEPGTGKSYLIEHLIVNALSNGHRSIFFADSVKRIKKLRDELTAAGLDHLLLEIIDPKKDVQKIRQALQYKSTTPKEQFDESNFRLLIQQCLRQKENLDLAYSHLQQPVFDKATWTTVIPRYLAANQKVRQDLLDNQLSTNDFTFHPTEYISLKEAVLNSEKLFRPINNLTHPLQQLNADIFLECKKDDAKQKVEEQLKYFIHQFEELHHRYILKQQDYVRDLHHNYDAFFEEASLKIEALKVFIEDNQILYGSDFEDSGLIQKSKLKVYGVFSGKHKNILHARERISYDYKNLKQLLQDNYRDAFQFSDNIDQRSSHKIIEHLNEIEDQLFQWQETQKASIPETLQRLNAKSIHAGLDYSERISGLEYSLDVIIEDFNEAKLYQLPLQNRMLTIPMRQLFIQDILNQLQTTKNNLPHFEVFYDWQRHWLLLPEVHRKLISAIIKVHPSNWCQAFESWYFYQRLRMDYHFKMPNSEEALYTYSTHLDALQKEIPSQIRQHWRQQIKKEKAGSHILKLSLNELINTQFQALSRQFPIIAISPAAAAQIQFTEQISFDIAITFSRANDLNSTQNFPANRTLHFVPSLPEDRRLLQKTFQLQYVHTVTSAPAFHFQNSLIHSNEKYLVHPTFNENTFHVRYFSGLVRHRVNPREAEAIAQDLIKASNDSSVKNKFTVVCLTVEQRDLIARKLYDYSLALPHSETGGISDFIENRLGLFHLFEPIISDYNTLIFSLTQDDFDARESSTLPQLHSKEGLQSIRKLISMPFEKINIYHSLSEEKLNRYTQHQTKKSARLLAQWIIYTKAIQDNNLEKAKTIIGPASTDPEQSLSFLGEVAKLLAPYIGRSRLEINANYKGRKIPLLIRSSNGQDKNIALLSEYCLHPNTLRAHAWKITQVKHLKKSGIEVFGVWSANWLEQPAMSARRLASAILKLDKH